MKLKPTPLVIGALSALALSGGLMAQHAFAQTTSSDDPMSSLVEKLATKFNLNKADVQQVFEEEKAAHQAERQEKVAERLTQAVTDGKLTTEQKDKIEAKQAEVKTNMDEIRALTDKAAAKTAMKALHDELKQWATDNDIDLKWVGPKDGQPGGHGGPKGKMMVQED